VSNTTQRGQDLAGETGQDPNFVQSAFAKIADRYVITNHVCSLGVDILWRKKAGKIAASFKPETILDLAAGTGDLALQLQKDCPDAELLATDFCPEMLAHADTRGVKHTQVADATQLPFDDNSYDLITVAFGLRNMSNWGKALNEMRRVLKPGGHLLILDFSIPKNLLGPAYVFYLNHILPKIAGRHLASKNPLHRHYLNGGLALLGLLFIFAHAAIMLTVLNSPEAKADMDAENIPFDFINLMTFFYIIGGILAIAAAALNFMSARAISARRKKLLIQITSGINCLSIPIGITLGIFTFIILSRPSVTALFEKKYA